MSIKLHSVIWIVFLHETTVGQCNQITLPVEDTVLIKWNKGERYQYWEDAEGKLQLVDQWMKISDFANAARFNPDRQNVYHLFTRQNRAVSQPFRLNDNNALRNSNFNRARRTVLIIHGWTGSATANVNSVLVPAFLNAEDINVIVVDWSVGASIIAGNNGPINAVSSGQSVARVMNWIMAQMNVNINSFHLVGFSLGAHQAAVAGRNVRGNVPYVTALDPGANMADSGHIFSRNAGTYTEAIHTNAEIMGHGHPLAHADFYPNGGEFNPGCGVNFLCNHERSFHYFAETLTTSGGFTGRRCATYAAARLGTCALSGNLRMGGIRPKTGSSGLYHLQTNASPPFNRG